MHLLSAFVNTLVYYLYAQTVKDYPDASSATPYR